MKRENVASAWKVAWHREKVAAYCRGETIGPVTLEMDLTSRCTRTCEDCPSCRTHDHHRLEKPFIERLFAVLQGRTGGLLLTGGEPTMADLFSWTLAEARRRGFAEIAVVTNGSLLDRESVAAALLEHATTIRVSLYDWDKPSCAGAGAILSRIEKLRSRIEAAGSPLKIGVSLLTSAERAGLLVATAEAVRSAGADWVYFHPVCVGWGRGAPSQVPQSGVLEEIEAWRRGLENCFSAYLAPERYEREPLSFSAYHAAHFLMILGADGLQYLGAEVKYQPDFVVADLKNSRLEDFLADPARLARISSFNSDNYAALGSRHRGALYSDLLERIISRKLDPEKAATRARLRFAHIL